MAEDINISPEMINNLVNMFKNNSNSNSSNDNQTNSTNIGEIFSNFSENTSSNNSSASIDFDTIMKIKSVMDSMNTKNDPKSNLLYSLKPYLRKSKQAKIDQYVNLLKISQITNLFNNEKTNNEEGDVK